MTTSKSILPKKVYAVVLADGTTEEFKTKSQAIARGDHSGQAFTVLSPRGYEVHVQEAPAPRSAKMLASKLEVGMTVVGTTKKEPEREIARLSIGKKWVTAWDSADRCFGYWPLTEKVTVVEAS